MTLSKLDLSAADAEDLNEAQLQEYRARPGLGASNKAAEVRKPLLGNYSKLEEEEEEEEERTKAYKQNFQALIRLEGVGRYVIFEVTCTWTEDRDKQYSVKD